MPCHTGESINLRPRYPSVTPHEQRCVCPCPPTCLHPSVFFTVFRRAYNDIDIFVCNGDESGGDASGFETILAAFEKKLVENGHTVEKRLVKYFVAQTGDANVDTVVADGDVGRKRLVDYTLAGIPISVSLVNTLHQRNIVAVLNSFDLSACAIR